ncbi:MAG: alpha/beta fold hydrolase, partial [Geminicoccaceae bacterium]
MNVSSGQSVELAAQAYGDHGEPIVILHGLLGSGRNWTTIARQLGRSYRVVTLDLRNHGGSPWADEVTYEAMAGDVRAFVEHAGLGPVTLIGHSMGGKTAMHLALTASSLIRRLVVVDIAPVAYRQGFGSYVEAMRAIDVEGLSSRGEIDQRLAGEVPEPAVRAFLLQNLARRDTGFAWRANLAALASGIPALTSFPNQGQSVFSSPALFLAGANSDYVQAGHGAEIER